jgi:hypothetical protein
MEYNQFYMKKKLIHHFIWKIAIILVILSMVGFLIIPAFT